MYKITIEHKVVEMVIIPKQWETLAKDGDKEKRGYTPEGETRKSVTRTVYEQHVDDESFDITAIIKAVNKLE